VKTRRIRIQFPQVIKTVTLENRTKRDKDRNLPTRAYFTAETEMMKMKLLPLQIITGLTTALWAILGAQ
jgi:hypothetical protein